MSAINLRLETSDRIDEEFKSLFTETDFSGEFYKSPSSEYLQHILKSACSIQTDSQVVSAFMIVLQDGKVVGRAAVIGSGVDPTIAYLGCYDVYSSNDGLEASQILLKASIEWAATHGYRIVYGPVDRSTWYNYRFRIDQDSESRPWEPKHPPEYVDQFLKAGFKLEESYSSWAFQKNIIFDMKKVSWAFRARAILGKWQGYRAVAFAANWEENMVGLFEIAMNAFEGNFLFEPIAYEEFLHLYQRLGTKIDFSPSFFLMGPDGRIAGFLLAYYDSDMLIVKTLGIRSDLRGRSLARILMFATLNQAARSGYQKGVAAMMKSGNGSLNIARLVDKLKVLSWVHSYALYSYKVKDSTHADV